MKNNLGYNTKSRINNNNNDNNNNNNNNKNNIILDKTYSTNNRGVSIYILGIYKT
jgi:hypothetical protein